MGKAVVGTIKIDAGCGVPLGFLHRLPDNATSTGKACLGGFFPLYGRLARLAATLRRANVGATAGELFDGVCERLFALAKLAGFVALIHHVADDIRFAPAPVRTRLFA